MTQEKGNNAILFNGIELKNLAEGAISYEVGEFGDVLGANDTIVHLRKNKNSIVSAVNVTVVKGAENVDLLLLAIAANTVGALTVKDEGNGFSALMTGASITTLDISDTTNSTEIETYTFSFKGVLNIIGV